MTESIKIISKSIDDISPDIDEFVQAYTIIHKKYRYLCGVLVDKLLKLDKVEASGDESIRALRKEEVDRIQDLLAQIDQCKF